MTWLATDGKQGAPTEEYLVINQARYLGVAPWEYIGRADTAGDACWMAWVDEALAAERDAAKQRERLQAQVGKHRPKGRR